MLINIYAPNIGAPKYIKKILVDFKKEIYSNTVIVGDYNTPLSPMDRSSRPEVSRETATLNDTSDHTDLIDIYRPFHSKTAEYTFFSSAHETLSKKEHVKTQNKS